MYSSALPFAVVGITWAIMGANGASRREFSIYPAIRTKITFSGNAALISGLGAVVGGLVMATPTLLALITDSAMWGDYIVRGFLIGFAITIIGILLGFMQNR